ncbi:MAG: hypothetical protein EBS53_00060 [Bacteroidetes bacterium]|nr:hypothetical protein [Bacteroidota bacterium]
MSDTNHNVNVNVKTHGAEEAAEDIAAMGKQAKKIHQQTLSQNKKEAATTKTTTQQAKRERAERKKEAPRELRDLQARNRLFATENKIRRERLRLLANEERRSRSTFRGGFRGGLRDRLLPNMPRDRGEAGQAAGALLGGVLSTAVGTLAAAAVSALTRLVAMPFRAIGEQYESYRNYAQQLSKLAGYAGGGASAADIKSLRLGAGQALGYSPEEVISAAAMTSRATGSYKGTGSALALSRVLGQDVSETTGMLGQMRQAGYKDFTSTGAGYRDLTKAMAAGVASGLEKARLPEFLSGVMDLTSKAAGRAAGDVSTAPFAQLLSTLARSGVSGLQGARGAAVASALEEGFTSPGGGEEGRALALHAMSFGRGKSYYAAIQALERGTAGDPQFIKQMIDTVSESAGSGEEANLAIKEMLGGRLTTVQIEAVRKALKAGEDPTTVLGEALESERDILRDIRSLLSGGNDEFLHESRRAASIANENIDNGAQLKDALESIQDVLREFITQNIDTVRTVLTELATFMEEMRPVLRAISMALSDLVKFFSDSDPRVAVSTTKMAKDLEAPQVENMRRAQQQFLATRALTQDPELAYQGLITDYAAILENPATAHGIATTFEAGGATQGPLPVSDVERTVLSTLDRFARERGFDPAAHGGSGATDTRAEMQAMMSYVVGTLQFAVPSSVRAIVDRTGGPQ